MNEPAETPGGRTRRPGPRRVQMFARPPSLASRAAGPFWFTAWMVWLALPVLFRWVTFVPSTEWKMFLWIPTLLLGIGSALWLVRWMRARNPNLPNLSFLIRVGGLYVLFPLFLLFMSWCNVGYVLPGILSHYLAPRRHEVATLHKSFHEQAGRRDLDCKYRVEGSPFDESFHGYYCAWQREWNALPVDGPMEIRYRAS